MSFKPSIYSADHVLPRPVDELPDYAYANARQSLAERLVAAFSLSGPAAAAIADAVVDPSAVRKGIGEPAEPRVEELRVPGGTLLAVRTEVWSRLVMPDPRNPRIGPARRHPFAVDPGSGGEDSRFRPVPEPKAPAEALDSPELVVDVESRDHLAWASTLAAKYVLAENDWRKSIASQGVMEPVWLAATTYHHADGGEPRTVPVTIEGSSRLTAVHDLLGARSADVPYGTPDAKFRADLRRLNETRLTGATAEQMVALRCERVPALIVVGFRRHGGAATTFQTAIKSLVALRHVDPPKPWGEGPENESLADEVLDELRRQGLITATEAAYLAGSCTRAEAEAAHLPSDPARRAARIVALLTSGAEDVRNALRVAVTSQSTRKNITAKLKNELATALILRAMGDDRDRVDQVRRYLRHAYGKAVHRGQWEATGRDADALANAAEKEVGRAITAGDLGEPGPASLELAVRAAYPLIAQNRLNADRGTANNDQPDRRTPGEILDAMRRTPRGVAQIAQALRDFGVDRPIRAVDESGACKPLGDGSGDQLVTDVYLRDEFPPRGKARSRRRDAVTPLEVFEDRLSELGDAVAKLKDAHAAAAAVLGDDGQSLAEAEGIDPQLSGDWREVLDAVDDDLNVWARRFRKRYGRVAAASDVGPPSTVSDEGEGSNVDGDDWEGDGAEERPDAA